MSSSSAKKGCYSSVYDLQEPSRIRAGKLHSVLLIDSNDFETRELGWWVSIWLADHLQVHIDLLRFNLFHRRSTTLFTRKPLALEREGSTSFWVNQILRKWGSFKMQPSHRVAPQGASTVSLALIWVWWVVNKSPSPPIPYHIYKWLSFSIPTVGRKSVMIFFHACRFWLLTKGGRWAGFLPCRPRCLCSVDVEFDPNEWCEGYQTILDESPHPQ